MIAKIRKTDHTGDSVLVEYETTDTEAVEVAQEKLTDFLEDCVKRYGSKPPVWARRQGEKDFDQFSPSKDNLATVDEVILQFPMVGG